MKTQFSVRKAMNREGYDISTGDGCPAFALDANAICQAVLHYFGGCNPPHEMKLCPFCKQILNRK